MQAARQGASPLRRPAFAADRSSSINGFVGSQLPGGCCWLLPLILTISLSEACWQQQPVCWCHPAH